MKCEICNQEPCKCENVDNKTYDLFKSSAEQQFTEQFKIKYEREKEKNEKVNDYRKRD